MLGWFIVGAISVVIALFLAAACKLAGDADAADHLRRQLSNRDKPPLHAASIGGEESQGHVC